MPTSKTWPDGATGASPTSYNIPLAGELNWASLSTFLLALADGAQSTVFQKFAVRKAIATPVTVSATTDCVVVTDLTVAGAVAVNLPAGANKIIFVVVDGKGDAATNNITITPNGAQTIAGAASLVLNNNREAVWLIYNSGDTDWKIINRGSGASVLSNPMTTAGDIIYGLTGGAPARLAAGAANTMLQAGAPPSYTLVNNANVGSSAAIAYSKLAALTSANILVGSAGNVATVTPVTGDISIDNAGVTAIASGVIVNADVNASAAIAGTKISPAFGTQNVSATGTLSLTGVATITAASSQLTDLTGSGTTDFKITSNSSTGTSKLSIGHSGDNDAGYMQYNVAAGTISWGTNGSTNTMILSSTSELKVANGSNSLPAFSFTGDPDTGMYNVAANSIGFATGGTRRLTIDSAGLLFQNGASSLNYYDEGSWTPSAEFQTSNGTRTNDVATGRYTRVGRMVQVGWRLEVTKGTASGNLRIGTLPFAQSATTENAMVVGITSNIALASTQMLTISALAGSQQMEVSYMENNAGRTQVTAANLGATFILYGSGVYYV